MQGGARPQSHSIHPTLVVLPLVLLSTAVIFDFVHLLGGSSTFTLIASYMILSGLVTGVIAAVFGWIDHVTTPRSGHAFTLGVAHGLVNLLVLALYAGSLCVRANDPGHPQILSTIFSTLGAGFALIGACLGGELADRLRDADQGNHRSDELISLSIGQTTPVSSIFVQRQQS